MCCLKHLNFMFCWVKMNVIKNLIILMVLLITSLSISPSVLGISPSITASSQSPFAYYGDNVKYLFPSFSDDKCEKGQDFFIEIPVAGCSPAIVRSDLLEEQDVPVFCRLVGTKLNPLIEVPFIQSIRLDIPEKNNSLIKHVLFHPARAGLKSTFTNLISSPQLNDLGYLVVILKKQESEKKMPDVVTAELVTKINYVIEKSIFNNSRPNDDSFRAQSSTIICDINRYFEIKITTL